MNIKESKTIKISISEESHIKIGLQALMEGKTFSNIIDDFGKGLTEYTVHRNGENALGEGETGVEGYIYFIQVDGSGPIKIGYSKSRPNTRIKELSTGMSGEPHTLAIIKGSLKDEANLHARFNHLRIKGEWFENCFELNDYISKVGKPHLDLS